MRISEMSPRAVRADPVEILLRRTRYVPANPDQGTLEHWTADLDAEPEVAGLLLDNAAFALMAEWFGNAEDFNKALLGTPYGINEPDLDAAGEPRLNDDGTPMMRQRMDPNTGEPMIRFDPPPNRAKAVQDCIAIALHRDTRAVGAAMMPDLIDEYYTSLLVAMQIGQGVDPTTAEESTRKMLVNYLGIDLALDANEQAKQALMPKTPPVGSPSSPGPAPTSPPEEPSPSSGG